MSVQMISAFNCVYFCRSLRERQTGLKRTAVIFWNLCGFLCLWQKEAMCSWNFTALSPPNWASRRLCSSSKVWQSELTTSSPAANALILHGQEMNTMVLWGWIYVTHTFSAFQEVISCLYMLLFLRKVCWNSAMAEHIVCWLLYGIRQQSVCLCEVREAEKFYFPDVMYPSKREGGWGSWRSCSLFWTRSSASLGLAW